MSLQRDGWEAPAAARVFLERDVALLAFDDLDEAAVVHLVHEAMSS